MKTFYAAVGIALLVFLVGSGFGADPANPEVPENLKVPAGERLVLMAHAKGVQIYVCQNADQKPAWTLKAPEAELADEGGKTIIHHSAGPSWKHTDGSEVTGKLVAKHDAPNGNAIPWLLLSAATHNGNGVLAKVTTIQRMHTEGGLAPTPDRCNASSSGQESRSAYSADYYFYAPTN
jgi:Protein of unknown function (DUF3455).